jgi:hypothetical protein
MAKTVEVEHDELFYAAQAAVVKYFEWSRLYQGIRLSIDFQV